MRIHHFVLDNSLLFEGELLDLEMIQLLNPYSHPLVRQTYRQQLRRQQELERMRFRAIRLIVSPLDRGI
jgi:hypothetical protein